MAEANLYRGYSDNNALVADDSTMLMKSSATRSNAVGLQEDPSSCYDPPSSHILVSSNNSFFPFLLRRRTSRGSVAFYACAACWAVTVLALLVSVVAVSFMYMPQIPRTMSPLQPENSDQLAANLTRSIEQLRADLASSRRENDAMLAALNEKEEKALELVSENKRLLSVADHQRDKILNLTVANGAVVAAINATLSNNQDRGVLSSLVDMIEDKDALIAELLADNARLTAELDAVSQQRDTFWEQVLDFMQELDEIASRRNHFYCFLCR